MQRYIINVRGGSFKLLNCFKELEFSTENTIFVGLQTWDLKFKPNETSGSLLAEE